MLIVKLEAGQNATRANQVIIPALKHIPEGWAVVPPELEAEALALLPWLTLEVHDGVITGVGDAAPEWRIAQSEGPAVADPAPAETV